MLVPFYQIVLGIVDTVAQWVQNYDVRLRDLDQMPLQDVIDHVPFIVYRCATVLSVLG